MSEEMNQLKKQLATAQAALAMLERELAKLKGNDPWIEVEGELILFTEIKSIRPDPAGGIHLGLIAGRERWTNAISARALADLLSAHYRRQALPPPAPE